jgi:hypothetical protein
MNSLSGLESNPREVQIRTVFLRVGEIDTLNEKFYAEILVECKWEEPELKNEFESSSNGCSFSSISFMGKYKEERELNDASRYWNPMIYVENALNDPKCVVHYKIKKELAVTSSKSSLEEDEIANECHKSNAFFMRTIKEEEIDKTKLKCEQKNMNNSNTVTSSSSPNFVYWMYEYRKIKGYFFEKLELDYFPLDVKYFFLLLFFFY